MTLKLHKHNKLDRNENGKQKITNNSCQFPVCQLRFMAKIRIAGRFHDADYV